MRKPHSSPSGATILVVDVQEDSLVSVRRLLERHGHHVVTARSGEEALAALEKQRIQVALVDYAMPQMSGVELIGELRGRDPFLQVILHTAYCSPPVAHSLLKELGIQGFHDKTDGPDKLLLWIQAALKRHRSIDKLRKAERTHRDLIAHASHELKNPLHVISGYGEALLSGTAGTLTTRAEPVVRVIAGQAHGLTEMTSNILLYSKLVAEPVESTKRDVDVSTLLRDVPDLVQLLLAGKSVAFSMDVESPTLRLETDPEKVRIILHNLLSNAAKFTSQGSIYLRAATNRSNVELVVRDSGQGIAPEHLEDVFEPFWQAGSAVQGLGGIGLGLTVSRRLASSLGGRLQVESELGVGSTFILTLPRSRALEVARSRRQPNGVKASASDDIKKSRSPFGFFRPF